MVIILCIVAGFIMMLAASGLYKLGCAAKDYVDMVRPRIVILNENPIRVDKIEWIGTVYLESIERGSSYVFIITHYLGEDTYLRYPTKREAKIVRRTLVKTMWEIGMGPVTDEDEESFYKAIGEEIV